MLVDYDAIGMRIKIARIRARISQETLAERTNFSTTHISNIETGNTKLSLPAIMSIANALSLPVEQLLCDNVAYSTHIYCQEAQEVLEDCSPEEIRILLDILKGSKEALRRNEKFIKRMNAPSE